MLFVHVLTLLGISLISKTCFGQTRDASSGTTPGPQNSSSPWYTSYSPVYNKSIYSCWAEGIRYEPSYWTDSYTYVQSYLTYYTSYTSGLSTYFMSTTSFYNTGYWLSVYKRSANTNSQSMNTTCGYIDKWKLIPYQCSYSSCSQLSSLDGNEFWKTVYSGSSSSYCQYSPISSYQCNTLYDRIGNWSNSQWNYYYSNITSCDWNSRYFQDSCSNLTNSNQVGMSCSPFSAQYTSFCYPQYGSYSNFYTLGTSCKSYYQWFTGCVSCGYNQNYYYDYSSNTYSTSYSYRCGLQPIGIPSATFGLNYEYMASTSNYTGYTSLPYAYSDFDTFSSRNYTYSYSYYNGYYTNAQWSTYQVKENQFCSYTLQKAYSWYNVFNGTTYWNFNVNPMLICDVFGSTTYVDSPSYTSCSTSFSYLSTCDTYSWYSYTTYGMISFSQYTPRGRYCYESWVPNQNCQKCQSLTSPYNSVYSSCDSLTATSYLSNYVSCQQFQSNYFSCSQIVNNSTVTTPSPTVSPWFISYSSWDRKWLCTEIGNSYSTCQNCQSLLSYSYQSPYCYSYYTSSYVSGWYSGYYTSNFTCRTGYNYYTSICTNTNNSMTPTTISPSSCSTNYCLNNGTCVTNGCPYGYSTCCVCPPDYVGERCETNRTFVITSRLRMMDSFLPSLLDPSTEMYKNYSTIFTSLWYNVTIMAIRQTYGEVDTVNLRVVLTRFKPGSIIAILITHGAIFPSNVSLIGRPIQITEENLRNALAAHCGNGGECDQFNLDRNHLVFNATPNVCEESSMHLCSPNAQCTFYRGVEYVCSCLPGYRDESFSTRIGSVCTEICHKHKCENGGRCSEIVNSDVDCSCPIGFTGKYCEMNLSSQTSHFIWGSVVLLLIIFNFVLFYQLIKKRKMQVRVDSKEPLMN
jgi:hypothetical protein